MTASYYLQGWGGSGGRSSGITLGDLNGDGVSDMAVAGTTYDGMYSHGDVSVLLASNEAKQWLKEIRHLLVILHIEFFNNLGQLALQQNQPGQARLAFERGAQYLRKQPDALYSSQLKAFEAQLARANAILQNNLEPSTQEVNELTEGLRTDEIEGDWKKKAIYD